MQVEIALKKGCDVLKSAGISDYILEVQVLLCYVLNCDKTFLFTYPETELNSQQKDIYLKLLNERSHRKPIQYILGYQEFMSLNFKVSEHVLIPRQDTEVLVEAIIDIAKNIPPKVIKILDIATGSGCIAISLAKYIENSLVTAIDICESALGVAIQNAVNIGVADKIRFIQQDILCDIDLNDKFDIIASNPPYIPLKEIEILQPEVNKYEPIKALNGGEDGLIFYREITKKSLNLLNNGGILAFEVGYNQSGEVFEIMKKSFYDINVVKDLNGINRVIYGKLIDNSN